MNEDNVCYAKSSPAAALTWITLAFFAGFAGVSAYGPIIAKLKETMAMGPFWLGLLASCPALTGSLLRIPFGAMVDRYGGKIPILVLLGLAAIGVAGITMMFALAPTPTSTHYPFFLLFGILCGCGIAIFSVGIPSVSYWYPQKSKAERWRCMPDWVIWHPGYSRSYYQVWSLPWVLFLLTFFGLSC